MVRPTNLLDLLGVGTVDEAVALWPATRVSSGIAGADARKTIEYLNKALSFRRVRPGGNGGLIGVSAEVYFQNPPVPDQTPFVLSQMPDVTFRLLDILPADHHPARLSVVQGLGGPEVVIESLPVEIRFPTGMLEPDPLHLGDVQTPPAGELPPDGLVVVLRSGEGSSVFVRVKVRMTEEMDFIIEPAVPISVGRSTFLSLPCRAIHEMNWVPSPKLSGEHDKREQALEWTRHAIDQLSPTAEYAGLLTARTIDLDAERAPFIELLTRMNALRSDQAAPALRPVEFVLEDIALPFCNITGFPIPSHGQFGMRRRIELGDDAAKAFKFSGAPVEIALPWSWRVLIDELWIRTVGKDDTQPIFFQAQLVFGSGKGKDEGNAFTLGVTDQWTLQAGWRSGKGIDLFTIFGVTLSLWGAKIGWSFSRAQDPAKDWSDIFQFLLDLSIKSKPGASGAFELRNSTGGPLNVALHNFGWDRGSMALEKASLPEGAVLAIARVFLVEIDEMGFVSESNGAEYFSFSGGIAVAGKRGSVGGGITVYRLRGRTGGNLQAPAFLLDGASLEIFASIFHLYGFGMYAEFRGEPPDEGTNYSEFGFGLKIDFKAIGLSFSLGAQCVYGHAEGAQNFKYFVVALQFSPIPAGVVQILDVRALAASNMTPDLPPPDGQSENLRVFRWYKGPGGEGKITLSAKNRSLGGWKRKADSWAVGLGAGVSLPVGRFVNIYNFTFLYSSPENAGLMVLFEGYLFRSGKPVGYGVLDLDWRNGVWSVAFGVGLTLANLTGIALPDWIGDTMILSGTLYIGNKPTTVALGRLADQSTWLTFNFGAPFLDSGGTLTYCFEAVDKPEGPVGVGFALTVRGGWSFGIGSIQLYAGFGFMAGCWRNEATSGGWSFWFQVGLRIKIFWIFTFGIGVKVDFTFMGRTGGGSYKTLTCLIVIETPWFLPDVTIRFSWTWGDRDQLERLEVVSTPITAACAIAAGQPTRGGPGGGTGQQLEVTALIGGSIDEKAVYSFGDLKAAQKPALPAQALTSVPVAIDSTIAIDFKPAVENKTTKGVQTEDGSGVQKPKPPAHNDVAAKYEITAFAVKRRPRFGAGAGAWIDSLKPEDTRLKKPWDYGSPEELTATFTQKDYGWKWNADFAREGRLDPREILLNSAVPYTIVSSNPEVDESIARNMPGWPCCPKPPRPYSDWHSLDFKETAFGDRAPATQLFAKSQSRLKWVVAPPPVVVPASGAAGGNHAAVFEQSMGAGIFAVAAFDEPVYALDLWIYWLPGNPLSSVALTAYLGLEEIARKEFNLQPAASLPVRFLDQRGFDSLVFSYSPGAPAAAIAADDRIELVSARYLSLRELAEIQAGAIKCKIAGEQAVKGYGKFSWLPNHEYAVSFTTKVTIVKDPAANGQGGQSKETEVDQTAFFRTKGMIGLNAVKRTGDEVEPYVESCYPAPGPVRLYREEPVALAFNEDFNIVLPEVPFERMPNPDEPLGLSHVAEWVLTVDKIGGAGQGEHLSETGEDWIGEHSTRPLEMVWGFRIADSSLVKAAVREAATLNPFKHRYSAMLAAPGGCNHTGASYHKSLVLLHGPADPQIEVGARPLWPADAVLRANMRLKGAPFTERTVFQPGDETAFEVLGQKGGGGGAWTVSEGSLAASQTPGRCYAVFGESTWNQVQIHTSVAPSGGTAGIALAVQASAVIESALIAVVDEAAGQLKLVSYSKGTEKTLASKPLPAGAGAQYGLEIAAFDDVLRAAVDGVEVECNREEFRTGKLALVAEGGGAFGRLTVEPLDAYRFEGRASHFASFADHIGSFDGAVTPIPENVAGAASPAAVASLFGQTKTTLAAAMTPGAERESRQRIFDLWTQTLQLPLRTRIDRLEISPVANAAGNVMLLLESPEPLPFSRDVTLVVLRCVERTFRQRAFALEDGVFEMEYTFEQPAGPQPTPAAAQTLLSSASHAVRARVLNGELLYDVYDLQLQRRGRTGLRIRGTRRNEFSRAEMEKPELAHWRAALETATAEEFLFLDERGIAIGAESRLMPQDPWETVPIAILTDGDENRAIVIPLSPDGSTTSQFAKGLYLLHFTLDRTRYRSNNPDQDSTYKGEATVQATIS